MTCTDDGGRDWSRAPPLLISKGTVVNHDGLFRADVLVERGKISKVASVMESGASGSGGLARE